jgi:hypothetical protein
MWLIWLLKLGKGPGEAGRSTHDPQRPPGMVEIQKDCLEQSLPMQSCAKPLTHTFHGVRPTGSLRLSQSAPGRLVSAIHGLRGIRASLGNCSCVALPPASMQSCPKSLRTSMCSRDISTSLCKKKRAPLLFIKNGTPAK